MSNDEVLTKLKGEWDSIIVYAVITARCMAPRRLRAPSCDSVACRSYKKYNDEPAAVQYDGPANYTQIGAPQCNVQELLGAD